MVPLFFPNSSPSLVPVEPEVLNVVVHCNKFALRLTFGVNVKEVSYGLALGFRDRISPFLVPPISFAASESPIDGALWLAASACVFALLTAQALLRGAAQIQAVPAGSRRASV